MEKIIFGDIETEKKKFYQHKKPISIKNIESNKIKVSNKVRFGKKGFIYFIGYKDGRKIWTLCMYFSQK